MILWGSINFLLFGFEIYGIIKTPKMNVNRGASINKEDSRVINKIKLSLNLFKNFKRINRYFIQMIRM